MEIFIPVKKYTDSKERLSTILSKEERALLAEKMALKTVNAFLNIDINADIILISNDPQLAIDGATTFVTDSSLNAAIHEAISNSQHSGLIMIAHADLPRINTQDIESIIKEHNSETVTIISDESGTGTNSLLFDSSIIFNLKFGQNSFALFQKEFTAHDIPWRSPPWISMQQDLDSSDDYFKLIEYINA